MLLKKELLYIVVIISIAGFVWLGLKSWHYKPFEEKNNQIISLENQLPIVGNVLNICEANLTKQNLQGFIDGIGENHEDIVIGFDNLST
ncbi:MAG: hypothetical protein J7L15_06275 [Clostridiales bacterium]|nr:hypothetical protein [Clostridiales bacterium]